MKMTKKLYLGIASLFVAVGAVAAVAATGTTSQAVSSYRNCNNDAIMRCGAITEAELRQKYDSNTGDAQAVYRHYGISRSDLAGSTSTIKHGTVYQDGRIVVDGKTVATNAYSVSRVRFSSQSTVVRINGTTYYQGPNMSVFTRPVDVYVYMRDGQFYRGVISSCGNPLMATPVKPQTPPKPVPAYTCESLKATKIDRTRYRFSTVATAKNGAQIVSYSYNFGDGKTQTVSNSTSVDHTYDKPGNYTITVTVNVKVDGHIKTVTSASCKVSVKVENVPVTPKYVCEDLNVEKISRTTYRFTTDATASGGAEIIGYTYNFGDGSEKTVTGTSVDHTYAKAGSYTTRVSVRVRVNGETKVISGEECRVTVKVEEVPVKTENCPYPGKEHLPKDSKNCVEEKEYCTMPGKEHLPVDSEECVETTVVTTPETPETPEEVTELPQTGFANTVVSGSIGLASLTTASYYWAASRKSLLSALLKR